MLGGRMIWEKKRSKRVEGEMERWKVEKAIGG